MQCPYVFARFFVLALCWFHATSLLALEAQEEYLNHLYQLVKERPLQDGELNLMPDEAATGFANTVRCFPEQEDADHTTDTSRKMRFERTVLKPLEKVIKANLVLKLPSIFSATGEIVLYKLVDGGHQELDRKRQPNSSTIWLELNIGPVDMMEGLELQLKLMVGNEEFLRNLNAMLVMYTYVEQTMPRFEKRHTDMNPNQDGGFNEVEKRNTDVNPNQDGGVNGAGNGMTECSRNTVGLEYSQFQWLGEDVTIISPPNAINFDYCAGHCNFSRHIPLPHELPQDFNTRTRTLEVLNQIGEHRLTPPPCCIPLKFSTAEIIYVLGDIVNLTTLPTVQSCGCRS